MGIIRCEECGGLIMGQPQHTADYYCKCNEKELPKIEELPEGWMDWNTLSLDQMVEYLRNKYKFLSSGDAKCIYMTRQRKHRSL